jgi:hypothetical protein
MLEAAFVIRSWANRRLAKCFPRVYRPIKMNASEKPRWFGISTISSEALLGIGITIAELGILCLLLGWAEYMRSVRKIAMIWAALGIVLVIIGGLTAAVPRFRDRRRVRADGLPESVVPPDEAPKASEAEEQLY